MSLLEKYLNIAHDSENGTTQRVREAHQVARRSQSLRECVARCSELTNAKYLCDLMFTVADQVISNIATVTEVMGHFDTEAFHSTIDEVEIDFKKSIDNFFQACRYQIMTKFAEDKQKLVRIWRNDMATTSKKVINPKKAMEIWDKFATSMRALSHTKQTMMFMNERHRSEETRRANLFLATLSTIASIIQGPGNGRFKEKVVRRIMLKVIARISLSL